MAYIPITHSNYFQCGIICDNTGWLRLELPKCVEELNDWELEWVT
jgi:hypothetical protein